MEKRLLIVGYMLMLSLWINPPCPSSATELPRAFLRGIEQYKSGDFQAAVEEFTRITGSGIKNGRLFYNLGNAYLKDNDLGHSILWYERALKLDPGDPDLRFNHSYALSQILDEKEGKSNPILTVLFFWKQVLGETSVKWIGIVLNLIVWVIFTIRHFQRKRSFRTALPILMILSVIFALTALYNYYETAHTRFAVVLPDAVAVRSGLTEGATELFTLHSGTKVKIEKEQKGHYRIFFSEGKIGWVRQSDVGVI